MDPIYIANLVGRNRMIVFGDPHSVIPHSDNHTTYSNQRIHPDDTVETIKRKILVELPSVSYEELYLYASVQPFLTVERTVKLLTCGNRFPISHHRLGTLCQNLKSPRLAELLWSHDPESRTLAGQASRSGSQSDRGGYLRKIVTQRHTLDDARFDSSMTNSIAGL